jgi:antitoxin component of MazEF toxin-antitoxin module
MNKSWSLALLALALASSIPLKAHAQENQLRVTQDKQYKVKVKGDKVIVRDKSKPVRRALEEQYAKIAEANKNKDLAALLALGRLIFLRSCPMAKHGIMNSWQHIPGWRLSRFNLSLA